MSLLSITDLHAKFENTEILKGINLQVKPGEIHAIMGPNGSGKSTLSKVLAGHPNYKVTKGEIKIEKENLLDLTPDERAQKGVFLVFQQPREISGVQFRQYLLTIHREKLLKEAGKTLKEARKDKILRKQISPVQFRKDIEEKITDVKIPKSFLERSLNDGFSGGEKKKAEILQMEILKPKIAILDELDSGLDVDALKVVCKKVNELKEKLNMGIILITHYSRILEYIKPDHVHLFLNGQITESSNISLAKKIEAEGYIE